MNLIKYTKQFEELVKAVDFVENEDLRQVIMKKIDLLNHSIYERTIKSCLPCDVQYFNEEAECNVCGGDTTDLGVTFTEDQILIL